MQEQILESIIFGLKADIAVKDAEIRQLKELLLIEVAKNDHLTKSLKQVNGLKEENEALYEERTALIAGTILERKDIIKDTAKEILSELDEAKQYAKDFYGVTEKVGVDIAINVVKKIFKQKGVEVE